MIRMILKDRSGMLVLDKTYIDTRKARHARERAEKKYGGCLQCQIIVLQ